MKSAETRLVILVLAAGKSRRFGASDKLTSLFGQKPLLAHALGALAGLRCMAKIAVVRNPVARCMAASRGFGTIMAPDNACAQATSLRIGINQARSLGASHVLLLLGDMPQVTREDLRRLTGSRLAHPAMSSNGRRNSPPALLPRSMFAQLVRIRGDKGAGHYLNKRSDLRVVQMPEGHLADIDTRSMIASRATDTRR